MLVLRISVFLAAVYAFATLCYLAYRSYGRWATQFYSCDKGSRLQGIIYAFTTAMMPLKKESASKHLISYSAGILYHIGIFAALVYLVIDLLTNILEYPINMNIILLIVIFTIKIISRVTIVIFIIQIWIGIGLICGAGLFLKRVFSPMMRAISCPDDYASNSFVLFFMTSALLHANLPGWDVAMYVSAIVLFLYVPIWKIRQRMGVVP